MARYGKDGGPRPTTLADVRHRRCRQCERRTGRDIGRQRAFDRERTDGCHLAWGLEGVAKTNAASTTLLPSSQAALGTLAPSAAASPLPSTAVGASGWADKLAAFCGKLAQNPLIAGTVGGAGTGLGVAVGKLSGVRQQLQEQISRIDALGQETAQIKAALVETEGTGGRKTGHSTAGVERLEDIVGIGEVYAERLRVAGVTRFAGLAALSAERIKEIVVRGPPLSIESIRSWIKQADALAKGGHPDADGLNHNYRGNPAMSDTFTELPAIPGLGMVGRGIYLRPQQPFELKEILFRQANKQIYPSKETGESYRAPEGYEVNDSPPMPAPQALNQMVIEESWERFEKQTSMDVSAAVSNAPFSIDVNASQTGQLRSEEEAYYALRNSFIPLWTVYIPDARRFPQDMFDLEVPTPYDPARLRAIFRALRHPSHQARGWAARPCWPSPSAVSKSSSMSKEDIKACQIGLGSASANTSQQNAKEKLQSNSECTVFGKGGDEFKLAALSSLDDAHYNEWPATIKDNPQVIEFDACGIWTLIDDDDKAKALRDAYIEATVFTPLRVVFNLDQRVHVFWGKNCFSYNPDTGETTQSRPIREKWPMLAEVGFEQVDASFLGKYLVSSTGEDLSRKLYFFNRDNYIRVDVDSRTIDPGYPKFIIGNYVEDWKFFD